MRIALDSGPLTSGHAVRGIGVMVSELIEALGQEGKKVKGEKITIDAFDFSTNYQLLTTSSYDIVHYPYFFPYALTLPKKKSGKKMIVTIQDLIHLIYPKQYPPGIRGKINFYRQKLRLKNIDAVITISETSKKDIVRFLGISAEKVYVVHLAPRKVFKKLRNEEIKKIKKKYKLPESFVLYVGDVNYNKNIPGLIQACKLAGIPLVIVGKHALEIEEGGVDLHLLRGPRDWLRFLFNIPHPELAHYKQLTKDFTNSKKVLRLGFVPNEDLNAIFNLATVYVQPSFYEGFGLPVLEAMACGTPVVIAKTNALVEIAMGAALVADPKDPREMAERITEILKNPSMVRLRSPLRTSLIKKGFERAREFSWEKTAGEMIEIYKLLASS